MKKSDDPQFPVEGTLARQPFDDTLSLTGDYEEFYKLGEEIFFKLEDIDFERTNDFSVKIGRLGETSRATVYFDRVLSDRTDFIYKVDVAWNVSDAWLTDKEANALCLILQSMLSREFSGIESVNIYQRATGTDKLIVDKDPKNIDSETTDILNVVLSPREMLMARIENRENHTSKEFKSAASPKELGAILRSAREEAGFTRADVARAMCTNGTAITRLEEGTGNPTFKTVQQYLSVIGATVGISPD